jgi:hypothetical protein
MATSLAQKGINPILQIRVIPHNSSEGDQDQKPENQHKQS